MVGTVLILGGAALIARGITGGTPVAIFTGTVLAAMGMLTAALEAAL